MKRCFLLALVLLACSWAFAQTGERAREYALYLEAALPGADFEDMQVPEFCLEMLGDDYEFIGRSDKTYGSYIAGVRRQDAPILPPDVHQSSYGGSFTSAAFRAEDDAGNIYYDFILGEGVQMQAYDGMEHLLICAEAAPGEALFAPQGSIFAAAAPESRARLVYGNEMGFSPADGSRMQLHIPVHNYESWQRGATDQPYDFYLNVTPPDDLLGTRFLSGDDLAKFTLIPIGLTLAEGEDSWELVISERGDKGILAHVDDERRLYEAGAGFDSMVGLAARVLGYRPGEVDFLGKTSVCARFEWKESRNPAYEWKAGCIETRDAAALRALDRLMNSADFSVGSVNCPSNAFLTIEYADGGSASFAVATNSFDLFFCNGMYFTAGNGFLPDILGLHDTDFYQAIMGG